MKTDANVNCHEYYHNLLIAFKMTPEHAPHPVRVYDFSLSFADGSYHQLRFEIDALSETFIAPKNPLTPFWARLDYQQCENCPLLPDVMRDCPVAINLIPLIELCRAMPSYESVDFEVKTAQRTVSAKTTLQRALSSILGLVMATSDCPHTGFLKPMAHFHLPLASEEETVFRATSTYLLGQYFKQQKHECVSFKLDGLSELYAQMRIINRALARRFKAAIQDDSTVNAIILLDLLSQAVNWSIEDGLEEQRYLFKAYGVE